MWLGLPGNPRCGYAGPVLHVSDWVSGLDVQYQLPVDFAVVNACYTGGGTGQDVVSFESLRGDHATHTQTIYNTSTSDPAKPAGIGRAIIDGSMQSEQEGMDAEMVKGWISDD